VITIRQETRPRPQVASAVVTLNAFGRLPLELCLSLRK
jgi:hypothetical protein